VKQPDVPKPLKLAAAAMPGLEYALPPGTRVGGVVIDSVLSVGEFGIVYHAVDPMLRRPVAVKEYFVPALCVRDAEGQVAPRSEAQAGAFATGRQAFVEEARLLAHLEIPGLLPVTGLFEDRGTVFRLMPFAPGRTLASWRAMYTDTLDEGGLRHLLSDLMVPLEALHAANLVHGYVLPEQVILAEGRPALLLGFGTVRRSLQGALDAAYTPMEQLPAGGHLPRGAWSDVYALAALARFAMSAQPVTASGEPPTAHALRARAPIGHALSHALERALSTLPGDRPQSMAALRQAMGLRHSSGPGAGMVDVTLPGGEAFDATATRPWPAPSIGASLRAATARAPVAEPPAVAAPLRPTPRPSPAPAALGDEGGPAAAFPLPGRPSLHEAPPPVAHAWEDKPPVAPAAPAAPGDGPVTPPAPVAPASAAAMAEPALPAVAAMAPPTAVPAADAAAAAADADADADANDRPAPSPAAAQGPGAPRPDPTAAAEPTLAANEALTAHLTAGPPEPAFDVPPAPAAPAAADNAPAHDPIPEVMANAAAHGRVEPPLHAVPVVPVMQVAPSEQATQTTPTAPVVPVAPVAPAEPAMRAEPIEPAAPAFAAAPAPALPKLQPIELPPDRPARAPAAPTAEEEEPIDDAVRAAIAAAIGSLPPAPPRRAPGALPAGAASAPDHGLPRIELPDLMLPPADAPDEAQARAAQRQRASGPSMRTRIIAALVGLLVLIAIAAVAWSAWKDATLNLGGG
tara:strand:+ start:468 stop:2699 length:2232 start_codon:yes stop_codon:yes gene_type:complete